MTFEPLHVMDGYIAILDMGMIWRMASPTSEDREKRDGTKFSWDDYATN